MPHRPTGGNNANKPKKPKNTQRPISRRTQRRRRRGTQQGGTQCGGNTCNGNNNTHSGGGGIGGALRTALLPFLMYSAQKHQQSRTKRRRGRPKTKRSKR